MPYNKDAKKLYDGHKIIVKLSIESGKLYDKLVNHVYEKFGLRLYISGCDMYIAHPSSSIYVIYVRDIRDKLVCELGEVELDECDIITYDNGDILIGIVGIYGILYSNNKFYLCFSKPPKTEWHSGDEDESSSSSSLLLPITPKRNQEYSQVFPFRQEIYINAKFRKKFNSLSDV